MDVEGDEGSGREFLQAVGSRLVRQCWRAVRIRLIRLDCERGVELAGLWAAAVVSFLCFGLPFVFVGVFEALAHWVDMQGVCFFKSKSNSCSVMTFSSTLPV